MFGEFHFLRPLWLLILPLAVALWWLVRSIEDPLRGWRRLIAPELLSAMQVTQARSSARWETSHLLCFWVALAVALAGPTWSRNPTPFDDDPPPTMIVFCSHTSMNQNDLSPSRLERAKLKVNDLVAALKGSPLGLIAYAETAHLVLPPTKDNQIVATMAAELSPDIMPADGNRLADAIALASRTLPDQRGTMLIISDDAPEPGTSQMTSQPGDLSQEISKSVRFVWLSIALPDSPEHKSVVAYAKDLGIKPVQIAPDQEDVEQVVQQIQRSQAALAFGEGSDRWTESGWWLLPIAALFSLWGFRREVNSRD